MAAYNRIIPGSALTADLATYHSTTYLTTGVVFGLCNTSADTVQVTMHIVPQGGSASVANQVMSLESVAGNSSFPYTWKEVIPANYTIQAKASTASVVSLRAWGFVNN